LALTSLGLYFNSLGSWLFMDPGESYYTEAAREMVEGHEYIVPHLNYQTYYSKPILTFWLITLSYNLFGVSEAASRLPFATLACTLVALSVFVTKTIADWKRAISAGFICAAAPLLVAFTKLSPIDLAFSAFLDTAVYGFLLTCLAGKQKHFYLIWLGLGLAVLTKGPAGLLLFGLGTALFLALAFTPAPYLWQMFKSTRPLLGFPLFLAVCAPWYFLVAKATKGVFLQIFFIYENLARFQGKTNFHKGSPIYYVPVLAYSLAPWVLIFPQLIKNYLFLPALQCWQEFRSGATSLMGKSGFTYRPHRPKAQEQAHQPKEITTEETYKRSLFYLCTWVASTFAFFSISKTQLDTYILPIIAPLSVILACGMHDILEAKKENRDWDRLWLTIIFWLISVLLSLVGLALAYLALFKPDFSGGDKALLLVSSIISIACSILSFKNLAKAKKEKTLHSQIFAIALLTALLHPLGLQYYSLKKQAGLAKVATRFATSKEDICLYGPFKPSVIYYLKRPVDTISATGQFQLMNGPLPDDGLSYGPTPSGHRQIVISDDAHFKDFRSRPELKFDELYRHRDWAAYELLNGYAQKPKSLEESFKWLLVSGHSLVDTGDFGPLTVPLGGGDKDIFNARLSQTKKTTAKTGQNNDRQ
jgi:4-amino-4-deoxy-L-arabinose transferase-like glycosyltransferase